MQIVTILLGIFSILCIGWRSLYCHCLRLYEKHGQMPFKKFGVHQMYCCYWYFAVQTLIFLFYSVPWVDAVSDMCEYCLFSDTFWTSTCPLIRIGVVYCRLSQLFLKIHKFNICIEEIFHFQICNILSACYEKRETWMGFQVVPRALS